MSNTNISRVLADFVATIQASASGKNKKIIDSQEEFARLGEFLGKPEASGKANQDYIRGLMVEFQAKNNYEEHAEVSKDTQTMVLKAIKSQHDREYTVTKLEAKQLVEMLRDNSLSIADRQYIIDVLAAGGFDEKGEPIQQPVENIKDEETGSKGVEHTDADEPKTAPEQGEKADEPAPKEEPVKPEQKPGTTKPEPGESGEKAEPPKIIPLPFPIIKKPDTKEPDTKEPEPKPEPKSEPKLMMADVLKGNQLGDEMASELNARFFTSDIVVREKLQQVDEKNAYNFFKTVELKANNPKPFAQIMDNSSYGHITPNEPLTAIIEPLDNLLAQAHTYGLENTDAFKALQQTYSDMKATKNIAGPETDIPANIKNNIDQQIQNLIAELDKKVVVE